MKFLLGVLAFSCVAISQAFAGGMFYKTQFTSFAQQPPHLTDSKVLYYGGPVISNVKVYSVFWGATVDSEIQKNIGGFYKAVTSSTHLDWADQYSTMNVTAVDGRKGTEQKIGRGSYGGEYLITPQITKSDLNDTDIRTELENQITNHVLPAPDENSIYMVYFPAGVSITIENQTSCSTFCAYHNGYASSKFGSIFYGVMPDLQSGGCAFGCAAGDTNFQSNTIISSHELMEAVSDAIPTPGNQPAFPQAWNTSDGQEIGDLCASTKGELTTPSGTYMVQGEWDNKINSCNTGPFNTK